MRATDSPEAAKKMEIPVVGWDKPVYIAQGTQDELVRYQDVVDFSRTLCENEAAVTLEVYPDADHSGPMNQGFDRFYRWVTAQFSGEKVPDSCSSLPASEG